MTRKIRRRAREMALQCLYAVRMANSDPASAVDFVAEEMDNPSLDGAREYCEALLMATVRLESWADEAIKGKLQNWDFNRVTFIDRLILELALVEMVHMDDVPPKVSISEAIEIAKIFSTDDSPGFINGVLDALYHDLIEGKLKE
ncbi:transcription antitermination factor NusB [Candidatus Neomarinimicrobiota bacterium]